jgi:hypothetical protein
VLRKEHILDPFVISKLTDTKSTLNFARRSKIRSFLFRNPFALPKYYWSSAMQTCSQCNASTPDNTPACVNCNANLSEFSATTIALKRMQANPRLSAIRVTVAQDACPHCYELLKTYPKNKVPQLPHQGCSHENGCRCFYEPVLDETALVGKVAG